MNTKASIEHNNFVSINDAFHMVDTVGETVTVILKGEPGVGKSTNLELARATHGDRYDYIYVDCPVKDVGETAMSVPNADRTRLKQIFSELFMLDSPKPKYIMLDEFTKTPKLLQVVWTRLTLEGCLYDLNLRKLYPGTKIFATANHSSDGVGDGMLAHAANRVTILNVRKPNAAEWLAWAENNGISAETRACVALKPTMLASYLDHGQGENPYIFNPKNKVLSFVSPRSLAKADVWVRNRSVLGAARTQAGLAGTIGVAAAEMMNAILTLGNEVPDINDILQNPDTVRMTDNMAALCLVAVNAVDAIQTQDDMSRFMKYVNRIRSSEVQNMFFSMAMTSNRLGKLAIHNAQIKDWARGNWQLATP